jgi:hypothetical protein
MVKINGKAGYVVGIQQVFAHHLIKATKIKANYPKG